MALCTAFRLWQARPGTQKPEAVASLSSVLLGGEGIARWRERLKEENRDKLIVLMGQVYGIFHLAGFALLTHLPLRCPPPSPGSPRAVLERFGINP